MALNAKVIFGLELTQIKLIKILLLKLKTMALVWILKQQGKYLTHFSLQSLWDKELGLECQLHIKLLKIIKAV